MYICKQSWQDQLAVLHYFLSPQISNKKQQKPPAFPATLHYHTCKNKHWYVKTTFSMKVWSQDDRLLVLIMFMYDLNASLQSNQLYNILSKLAIEQRSASQHRLLP